jgi:intracellular sulfur oxidation DsrE/DsrF family protein
VANYLFIESQGAFASATAPEFLALAGELVKQGGKVEILLVQNGVMAARNGARAPELSAAVQSGLPVFADEFSLKERALPREQLAKGVKSAGLDVVVDRMAAGWKVLWH